jgi:hypothetical protein
LKNRIIITVILKVSIARYQTSRELMPRILPQRILIAVLLRAESGIKLRKVKPKAIVRENKIPRIISGCNLDCSVRGPKIRATRIEKAKANHRGGSERANPKAEPAKAA